jgi:hypothetical protein
VRPSSQASVAGVAAIFPQRDARAFDGQPGSFEHEHVHQVSLCPPTSDRVCEDLVWRIHVDAVDLRLNRVQLEAAISHEVDNETFVADAQHHAAKPWGILDDLKRATERSADVRNHVASALERSIVEREQVQIVRGSVPEVMPAAPPRSKSPFRVQKLAQQRLK